MDNYLSNKIRNELQLTAIQNGGEASILLGKETAIELGVLSSMTIPEGYMLALYGYACKVGEFEYGYVIS